MNRILRLVRIAALAATIVLVSNCTQKVETYIATMTGAKMKPNPVTTNATGTVTFTTDTDSTITFVLTISHMDSVMGAHLQLGDADSEGPDAVALFEGPTTGMDFSGTLASGTIRKADLFGPLQGKELSELQDSMATGRTYTNVHTMAYPEGEVRGQNEKQ